jgi:DNA mismatch endonuclease, patch repair protein
MADVHSQKVRSYNMSRIRSKDTKPEMIVRKFLYKTGLRYRLHDAALHGKPDMILLKYRVVIFVNGCFWHSHHGCRYFKLPQTRREWWSAKLARNSAKDEQNYEMLKQLGWRVLCIWECDLKPGVVDKTLRKLLKQILKYKI